MRVQRKQRDRIVGDTKNIAIISKRVREWWKGKEWVGEIGKGGKSVENHKVGYRRARKDGPKIIR